MARNGTEKSAAPSYIPSYTLRVAALSRVITSPLPFWPSFSLIVDNDTKRPLRLTGSRAYSPKDPSASRKEKDTDPRLKKEKGLGSSSSQPRPPGATHSTPTWNNAELPPTPAAACSCCSTCRSYRSFVRPLRAAAHSVRLLLMVP